MATTDLALHEESPSGGGFGIVTGGDRTSAFTQARRHSRSVRVLRLTLPVFTAALVAGYAFAVLDKSGWSVSLPEISLRTILPEDLAMNNPHYDGFGNDGSSYAFDAKTARQDLEKLTLVKLNSITGWVRQADRTKTDITATRGTFDYEANILELFEEILVASESGLKARLTHATIETKESLLISNEPVEVEFPTGKIRSNKLTLRQKAHEITFEGSVAARLNPTPKAAADAAKPAPAQSKGMLAPSNGPVDITADRLEVNDQTKTAIFYGNVRAVQGDSTMTTPVLEVAYDGGAFGGAVAKKPEGAAAAGEQASKLRRIVAKPPVVMTRGEAEQVTSESAEFDSETESAVLAGNVVMASGSERRVTSDRVDLDQRADTALLTGSVEVLQGRNELKGRRLFVDRANGRAQMTSPPGAGAGPGRVWARLYQGQPKAKPAKAAAKSPANGGVDIASFKTDPSAPVDIDADQLDVDEASHVAVFRGSVHAIQGDFSISSAELHAFYTGDAGLADVTRESKGETQTELSRLEARRNVFVTSKDGRTVTGDWAVFDADANTVTVGGDVVLTQDKNSVRGTRLVIDMASGQSTIDTGPSKKGAQAPADGWVADSPAAAASEGTGRASAVFYPQQLKPAAGAAKPSSAAENQAPASDASPPAAATPPAATAPPTDQWGISTTPGSP